MDSTQKWLVGVGGAILGVLVTVQLYLHNANRDDMAAMENRISQEISDVGAALRGQEARIRQVEINSAVNTALSRFVTETIARNPAATIALSPPVPADDEPPAS